MQQSIKNTAIFWQEAVLDAQAENFGGISTYLLYFAAMIEAIAGTLSLVSGCQALFFRLKSRFNLQI